ncbi:MAG: molybdenum cofactor guanylyltransferase [Armatimonadota bacterium]|nr:molybdenum cofactor guanylyltransferase [Armatimonadota bacterium]
MGSPTGVVLAGGKSRRMGCDKATLPLGDRSLLAHVVGRLRAVCAPVLVVASRPDAYPDCGVPVIADRWPVGGPLAGLHAGLAAARTDYAVVVACDLPFITPSVLRGLVERAGGFEAAVPRVDGVAQPLCAVYHRGVEPVAEALLRRGVRSVRALLRRLRVHYVGEDELRAWDPDLRSFLNVNTPANYERALAML